ncbi:MAG: hypothetical protein RQ729_09650 [Wenzhouxiangellaceae bacterium]|nr:hypothetical protein [Wenzhouxiangellaceae bacterium]
MKRQSNIARQRGSALFVGLFLVAVVAVLAASVTLTSVTQQTGAVRALQFEQAWYAALGRIEAEAPGILATGTCAGGAQTLAGFNTTLSCSLSVVIEEGDQRWRQITLIAVAQRGDPSSASQVRRSARATLRRPE